MPVEIEKKFLVKNETWRVEAGQGTRYRQGYLCEKGPGSVRVRIEGDRANINIKSATLDMTRMEYEYAIPREDAEEMLDDMCLKPLIEKTRFHITYHGHTWEIDVFEGDNEGLVVAEIELAAVDEAFELPPWAGEEVSHDRRYYNVCLVSHPYKDWKEEGCD